MTTAAPAPDATGPAAGRGGSGARRSVADVLPVILGADIGVYALARAFHEEYGLRSLVVSGAALGPVARSQIIDNVLLGPDATAEQMVDRLVALAGEHPGRRLVLLANSDWLVRVVVRHRARLEPHYVVPFLSAELLDQISDKATFAQICEGLGIAVPRTIVQDFAGAGEDGWQPVGVDLDYPLIAKAASSADYQDVHFVGK